MMGERTVMQEPLFYGFSLERHVPSHHLLRSIDRLVDLSKVMRSIHEGARDLARDFSLTDAYLTSRRERKKVEMLFAHPKRILRLDRLRLRGPCGARDAFHLAAAAHNLREMAKLIPLPAMAMAG